MPESEPKFERKDPRAEVVKILQEKGMEDSEALTLLRSWMEKLQAEEGLEPEAHIETLMKVAELLHEAGQYDDAYDYFKDVIENFHQTGDEQRAEGIRERMRQLGYRA